MSEKIEFITSHFPEINLKEYCLCEKKDCAKQHLVIEIIIDADKDELWKIMKVLNEHRFSEDDIPAKITIEKLSKGD